MESTAPLVRFAQFVTKQFGNAPVYLVGTAARGDLWHDVDIRLVLPDEIYAALGFGAPEDRRQNKYWRSACYTYSIMGKQRTGLPIDFQFQQESFSNKFTGPRVRLL